MICGFPNRELLSPKLKPFGWPSVLAATIAGSYKAASRWAAGRR